MMMMPVKKTVIALLLFIAVQGVSIAQSTEIEGVWKMYETSFAGEAYGGERAIVIDYNKNGIIYQRGIVVGTWKYDKKAQTIMQKAERSDSEEMNGEASIIQLDDEKLIFKLNAVQLNLQKAGK